MNFLKEIVNGFRFLLVWWFIITPWEQAIRVRLGKHLQLFEGGVHLKIPFLDEVYVQSVRTRVCGVPTQNLTTKDGHTITVAGSLRYRIADLEKLYQTLHDATDTVAMYATGIAADYVVSHDLVECSPELVTGFVREHLNLQQYGLGDVEFFFTDFVRVKTYRFITGQIERYPNQLETSRAKFSSSPSGGDYVK